MFSSIRRTNYITEYLDGLSVVYDLEQVSH